MSGKTILSATIAWALFISTCLTYAILNHQNTLLNNGKWTCYELLNPLLQYHGLSSLGLRNSTQQNRIQNGNHGLQYTVFHIAEKLNIDKIQTTMHLPAKSWNAIVFDVEKDKFSGIIISNEPTRQGMFFQSNSKMKFIKTKPFNLTFPIPTTSTVSIKFTPKKTIAFINNQQIGQWDYVPAFAKSPGLIINQPPAHFKNITFFSANKKVMDENFTNTKNMWLIFAISLLTTLILSLAGIKILSNFTTTAKHISYITELYLLTALLCLSFAAFMHYTDWSWLKWLNSQNFLSPQNLISTLQQQAQQNKNITIAHPPLIFNKQHASKANETPVVFIGDSQTNGEFIADENKKFSSITKHLFNQYNKDIKINCLSIAQSGARADQLLEQYKNHLSTYKPKICILNIGYVDYHHNPKNIPFSNRLNEFINFNTQYGVTSIVLLQPLNPEIEHLTKIRDFCLTHINKTKLPPETIVWDLHQYLKSKNSTGFVWYDATHLTFFGHQLAGSYITYKLLELTQTNPSILSKKKQPPKPAAKPKSQQLQ